MDIIIRQHHLAQLKILFYPPPHSLKVTTATKRRISVLGLQCGSTGRASDCDLQVAVIPTNTQKFTTGFTRQSTRTQHNGPPTTTPQFWAPLVQSSLIPFKALVITALRQKIRVTTNSEWKCFTNVRWWMLCHSWHLPCSWSKGPPAPTDRMKQASVVRCTSKNFLCRRDVLKTLGHHGDVSTSGDIADAFWPTSQGRPPDGHVFCSKKWSQSVRRMRRDLNIVNKYHKESNQ